MITRLVVVALLGALGVGCGSSRTAAWDTLPASSAEQNETPEAETHRQQLVARANELWSERGDADKLREAIATWQQALESNPEDPDSWLMVSRARYLLADCHLRFDDTKHEEMVTTFEDGTQAAEKGLVALSDDFAERMRAGTRIEEALEVLGKDAVPLLYWRSSNMGKWGSEKDFATLLAYKDEVRAVMSHCLEKDPDYWHAGPHRYFGAYFARIPAFAGGDLDRSREHFERSLEAAPNYFATHVLFADDYGVKAQDRPLFEEHLNFVLNTEPAIMPDEVPEQVCEQEKARRALARADEVFE